MSQQTLIMTPVALFSVGEDNKAEECGNCACAIVGVGQPQPRYSLLCYSDKQETLCSSNLSNSNEQSLQFGFLTDEYASFKDDVGQHWQIMFMRQGDIETFCAHLGTAFYGAAQQPSHTAVIVDLTASTSAAAMQSRETLTLGKRAKVRYAAFALQRGDTGELPLLNPHVLETNGDFNYSFESVQSTFALAHEAKGFESSVNGMTVGSRRVVVVPNAMPRSGLNPFQQQQAVAFVITLVRVISDEALLAAHDAKPPPQAPSLTALVPAGGVLIASPGSEIEGGVVSSAAATPAGERTADAPLKEGSGIPAEHMRLVQKVAAHINTSSTNIRDLHDKVGALKEDWRQTVNRPKPSVLTSTQLEQHVKHLVLESERIRDELNRRDELISSLDERNRDLQRRVDKAAVVAQELLDEKKQAVSSSSDNRLELDRRQMKVQENISRARNERDDVSRHLQTVKKLLDVSDRDLRDVKGKHDVFLVQLQALTGKLDAMEDQLGEERSRRKSLEAKCSALQEEIRNATTEVHLKGAELEDTRRKADAERVHYAQIMEDERSRRAVEAQQLRGEIVDELQQKENKFQTDRARVSEEFSQRGRDEGRELGRRNGYIEVEAKLQELQLDAQRTKTELDAYKTQLRHQTDDAMAENRRLEAIVTTHKKGADESTRRKAQLEYQLQVAHMKCRSAEDACLLRLTSMAHRLSRPIHTDDLVALLSSIREGTSPNFAFQSAKHQEEAQDARGRRLVWITDELESQYLSLQASLFHSSYVPELTAHAEEMRQAVQKLWEEREASFFGELFLHESGERYNVDKEEEAAFALYVQFIEQLKQEQAALQDEEELHRASVVAESDAWFSELEACYASQRDERDAVCAEEEALRLSTSEEEERESANVTQQIEAVLFESIIAEQQELILHEEQDRVDIETNDENIEFIALSTDVYDTMLHDAQAAEARRLERDALANEEDSARRATIAEEDSTFVEAIQQPFVAEAPAAPPVQRQIAPVQQQTLFAPVADSDEDVEDVNNPASDVAEDDPLGTAHAATAPSDQATTTTTAQPPAPQQQSGAQRSMFEESDDEDDGAAVVKRAAPPKRSAAPAASKKPMFDSDSDSESQERAPPPKRAPAKRPGKASAKLFESDEDD